MRINLTHKHYFIGLLALAVGAALGSWLTSWQWLETLASAASLPLPGIALLPSWSGHERRGLIGILVILFGSLLLLVPIVSLYLLLNMPLTAVHSSLLAVGTAIVVWVLPIGKKT